MFCPHCGKEIADNQAFCQHCGSRISPEPVPGMGGREKTPWEDRDNRGFFGGLLKTVKAALFDPTDFFKKMPVTGGLADPLIYALIVGMVGMMFSYLWQILFQGLIQSYMPAEMKTMQGYNMFRGIGLAFMAFIAPFIVILGLFISTGIMHLFLMMVKGARAGFEATFRVASYSYSTNLLNVVPFCGGLIAMVWSIVLLIIGLKEAHETSGGKAAFAVLAPFVLVFVCCILMVFLFMGVLAASFGSMMQQQ